MIEINLLPGAGKKSRGAGAGVTVGASFATAANRVKDPFMLLAAASIIAAGAVIRDVDAAATGVCRRSWRAGEQKQVQDSTRYAAVLREKKKAETQRDSVMRQLNIIKTIDNNRFVWPHIMDEISRALPQYTWIVSDQADQRRRQPRGAEDANKDSKDKKKKPTEQEEAPQPMKFTDRRQHRRHPGADALHEVARSVAVHSERATRELAAGPGGWQGSDGVHARSRVPAAGFDGDPHRSAHAVGEVAGHGSSFRRRSATS